MLYPQYFIDDLKNRADLVRIIQPYAADLKKKGANWMACCPFHQEKTPSFSVNPSKGFYKCFGCGKGGTAFNFLMEMEGLNFPEAVQRVAEISGVMLPEPIDDREYEKSKKQREEKKQIAEQIVELNQVAQEYWEAGLAKKNAGAKAAQEYLEKRGISLDVQKAFRIGYSPDKWDGLLTVLRDFGADEKLIEQSGLVSVNEEKERTFDRFRGRIMFPVLDVNGAPVAFGARSLDPDDQPKYLNSPETPAYTKGNHLYGLFQSKDDIRNKKFAILVEGYLDLIALYQFGIRNVAASLGTALTTDQSKLLSRFTKRVVINYDGDAAGIKAARRAVEVMLPYEFDLKVLTLPNGQDPDDFVRANGADRYNELRGNASGYLSFVLNSSLRERNLNIARQKAEAIEEVMPAIAAVKNSIQKRENFDQAMTFFRIDDTSVKRDLWHSIGGTGDTGNRNIQRQISRAAQVKTTVAEKQLLELLINDADLRALILPTLEESDYHALATAQIFQAFCDIHAAGQPLDAENLVQHLGDDEAALDFAHKLSLVPAKRGRGEDLAQVQRLAENCVFTLRLMAIGNRILEISREAALAEQNGDTALVNTLVYEQLELEKIRRDLQRKVVET